MSSSCEWISWSSRSKGPSKCASATRKPVSSGCWGSVTRTYFSATTLTSAGRGLVLLGDALNDLCREVAVLNRTGRLRGPAADGLAGHGSLREADGAGDNRVEDLVPECLDEPFHNLASVQGTAVEHGHQDAQDLELEVEAVAHLLDGVHQQCEASQREVLGLHRDHHGVCARESVDGEQAERRLAVDDDEVVILHHRTQGSRKRLLAAD